LPSPLLGGIVAPQRFMRWETQRGCPFKCSFCQHRARDDAVLTFAPRRVLDEVRWLCAQQPTVADVAVVDPTFNRAGSVTVLHALARHGYHGRIALQCRAEMLTDEFLDAVRALQQGGATPVLEFGLQTIHHEEQRLIGRATNLRRFVERVQQVQRRGIAYEVSLIFGLPTQTLASFRESVHFCRDVLQAPVVRAFQLMLLRGTRLHQAKRALGLVESDEVAEARIPRQHVDIPHVVQAPSFSRDDWLAMARDAAALEAGGGGGGGASATAA
jgi:radical SAM superfamily enzyme YgiQ (UPF0313 family)